MCNCNCSKTGCQTVNVLGLLHHYMLEVTELTEVLQKCET